MIEIGIEHGPIRPAESDLDIGSTPPPTSSTSAARAMVISVLSTVFILFLAVANIQSFGKDPNKYGSARSAARSVGFEQSWFILTEPPHVDDAIVTRYGEFPQTAFGPTTLDLRELGLNFRARAYLESMKLHGTEREWRCFGLSVLAQDFDDVDALVEFRYKHPSGHHKRPYWLETRHITGRSRLEAGQIGTDEVVNPSYCGSTAIVERDSTRFHGRP